MGLFWKIRDFSMTVGVVSTIILSYLGVLSAAETTSTTYTEPDYIKYGFVTAAIPQITSPPSLEERQVVDSTCSEINGLGYTNPVCSPGYTCISGGYGLGSLFWQCGVPSTTTSWITTCLECPSTEPYCATYFLDVDTDIYLHFDCASTTSANRIYTGIAAVTTPYSTTTPIPISTCTGNTRTVTTTTTLYYTVEPTCGSNSNKAAAIAGGTIGGLGFVTAVCVGIWSCLVLRRRNKSKERGESGERLPELMQNMGERELS